MVEGSCDCGGAGWMLRAAPSSATVCNCSLCRRLGAMWAYDVERDGNGFSGSVATYRRQPENSATLEVVFCPRCAGVLGWRALTPREERRIAVNVRLAPAEAVAQLPVDHFDGAESFASTGRDGRRVGDYWG
jgi:hypothetical protein